MNPVETFVCYCIILLIFMVVCAINDVDFRFVRDTGQVVATILQIIMVIGKGLMSGGVIPTQSNGTLSTQPNDQLLDFNTYIDEKIKNTALNGHIKEIIKCIYDNRTNPNAQELIITHIKKMKFSPNELTIMKQAVEKQYNLISDITSNSSIPSGPSNNPFKNPIVQPGVQPGVIGGIQRKYTARRRKVQYKKYTRKH